MIDDDQIRRMLVQRASRAAPSSRVELADRARAIAAAQTHDGSGRGRLNVAWVAGVAAVAVIGVIAVGLLRPPPPPEVGPSPAISASSATSPSADASPSPDASAAPTASDVTIEPWSALTWYSGDDGRFEQPGRNLFIQAVAPWHDAWIAVGYALDLTTGHVAGVIVHSADGRAWERDPERPDEQFDRLLFAGDRIVIVGAHRQPDVGNQQGPTVPAMWISTTGRDWIELALPAAMDRDTALANVAVGGRGWLLRTITPRGEDGWLVGDPKSGWNEVTPDRDPFADAFIYDILGTDDGWMAIGMTGADRGSNAGFPFGDPGNDRGAIWSSPDGVTWTAARVDDPGTTIMTIHRVANGWIATGDDHGGCPNCVGRRGRMWRSADGRSWTPLGVPSPQPEDIPRPLVASDGERGLLFGRDDVGRFTVHETSDGLTWANIAVFIEPAGGTTPMPNGVLAVGPKAVVAFVDPSTESLDHFWMVPQVAIAGEPPGSAATQSPAPPRVDHDVVCQEPLGAPCSP